MNRITMNNGLTIDVDSEQVIEGFMNRIKAGEKFVQVVALNGLYNINTNSVSHIKLNFEDKKALKEKK